MNKLVYILAASHSGSTLTAMLLGAHRDLCSVGELKVTSIGDPDTYLCSCRSPIQECDFWRGVAETMGTYGEEFCISNAKTDVRTGATPYMLRLLSPLHRGNFLEKVRDFLLFLSPTWRRFLPENQKRNASYVRALLNQSNAEAVIDSSKIGIRLKYLLRNKGLEVKVVWLTRDGRGVALAYKNPSDFADAQKQEFRGGGAGRSQEQARAVSAGSAEWVRCNQEAQEVLKTIPRNQWTQVKYEDICSNTNETLDDLFNFIGVEPKYKNLNFRDTDHHIIGNGMRLDNTDVIKLDQRWQSELTERELEQFDVIAGQMNKSLGYV